MDIHNTVSKLIRSIPPREEPEVELDWEKYYEKTAEQLEAIGINPSAILGGYLVARLSYNIQKLLNESLSSASTIGMKNYYLVEVAPEGQILEVGELIDKMLSKTTQLPLLLGLPITIKDNFNHAWFSTRLGTSYFTYRPKGYSASIKTLIERGVIIIGKANMHELALGVTNLNNHTGTPLNPINKELIIGGSSGGSAGTVATGIAPLSIGTDAGGSVRIPAAWTGLYGFKPSRLLIDRKGVFLTSPSFESIGFIARNPIDIAFILEAFKPGILDDLLQKLNTSNTCREKILVPYNLVEKADNEIQELLQEEIETIKSLGCTIIKENLRLEKTLDRARTIITLSEAYTTYSTIYEQNKERVGRDIKYLLEIGKHLPSWSYIEAHNLITYTKDKLLEKLSTYDLILLPTTPTGPLHLDEVDWRTSFSPRLIMYTTPWNILDLPTITIPGQRKLSTGIPVPLQLVSLKGEKHLLATSTLYWISTQNKS